MKKNTASLVLAIVGAVFGFIGGILWAACAGTIGDVAGAVGEDGIAADQTIYMVVYIILGIGGGVLSLVGGIQSYTYKKGGLICSILGALFQVGVLIASCIHVGGFSFLLEICTFVAIVLLIVQVAMVIVGTNNMKKAQNTEATQPVDQNQNDQQ